MDELIPDPCYVAIGVWLIQATPQWSVVADGLTHAQETTLDLLILAGLLEEQFSVRAWMSGSHDEVQADCRVSGDYKDALSSRLISQNAAWLKDGKTVGASFFEVAGPRRVRLTANGELAKADWQSGQIDRLLAFVRYHDERPPCPAEIHLTNCATHARANGIPALEGDTPRVEAGYQVTGVLTTATKRMITTSLNARMLDVLTRKPECRGWTVKQWQQELKCSTGGIAKTKTWKGLMEARKQLQSDYSTTKHRRRKQRPKE